MTKLKEKINEALTSVLPITCIVFLLSITITPMPIGTMLLFACGAVMLIIGIGFFSLGADMSMMLMGEGIGTILTTSRKRVLMICITFIIGFIITIAEPDLTVLAHQVPGIPDNTLIWTVAAGVGIFLVMALLRIQFHWKLRYLLMLFYGLVFVLAYFSMDNFMAVAFDSGGVTTGPITVPFLMALGVGMANITQKHAEEESFGIVALCAALVLYWRYCFWVSCMSLRVQPIHRLRWYMWKDVIQTFLQELPHYMWEVSKALLPILCFFLIFQLISSYFNRRSIIKILIGSLYTYIGLILFLCGVNVGFMPAGYFIGTEIAALSYNWILIPIGMLIGFFVVKAEPAVHVLTRQVEDMSSGAISTKAMLYSLSIGVGLSLGIAMLRILTGVSIMVFLIPGYLIAISLSFFVPKVFTGIAFDSGGVASGPMTATFLLPLAMGACEQLGGNVMLDAFGIVAMVAMTPLLTIQILGLFMKKKKKKDTDTLQEDIIMEFEEAANERTES